jgi:membrane-associated phospholipid phosphatase/predicted MFS family arabinose efflux permease
VRSVPWPGRAAVAGLAAFSAAALAAGLGRAVLTTYLPVALARIRDAPGLIGLVMLVNVAAGFAVPLMVGVWSDRVHGRGHGRTGPFILGGSLVTAGGLLATALGVGSAYLLLAATALVAYVGLNAVTTAHRALIVETYGPDDRASATGAEELAMLVGTTLGVAVGGGLIEWRTWAPFLFAAVLVPLITLPTVLRMRGRERPPAVPPDRTALSWRHVPAIAARPEVARMLLAQGLWVLGYAALPAFFVLYAEHELGLGPGAAGGLLVGFGVVCGLSMLAAGAERRPQRHAPLLAAGVVLLGGGLLAMTPASAPLEAAPGLLAAAAGFGVVSTLGFPVLSRWIPEGEAGAYTAVYFSVRSIAGAVALPAAGGVIAWTGSYRALVAAGGVAALAALVPLAPLAVRGVRRPRRPSAEAIARRAAPLVLATAGALALGLLVDRTALFRADEWLFRQLNGLGPTPGLLDEVLVGPDFRNYVILVGIVAAGAVVWRRGRVLASVAATALAGLLAWLCVRVVWAVWERPRPQEALADIDVGVHDWSSYGSFPSGHVAVWLAMALTVSVVFPRLLLPLMAVVAVVAVTRVLGGAHFPSDVAGAMLIGWASARAVRPLAAGPTAASAAATTRAESRSGRKELTSSP